MNTISLQEEKQPAHSSVLSESKLPCPNPSCGSSDGYHLYSDGHGHCFSCRSTFQNGVKENRTFTYEYLPHWEISKETFQKYKVKTKIDDTGKPVSVGFIYPNKSIQIRLLTEKKFYTEGDYRNAGLFGTDVFEAGCNKTITIAEGAKDALSLYEVLKTPVVSVKSASTAASDCITDRAYLNSFEKIYFALDADRPGRDALAECAKLFDYNKVYVVQYNRKDANEYLVAGDKDALKNLWYNAKRYLPENIVSSFSEFKKILFSKDQVGVPYPFPKLNEMTYGIRPSESVLVTAQEGVGKTEFMRAVEYQLLRKTDAHIAAIFLEETKRRHLQALAGIELGIPVHLPDCPVNGDDIYHALQNLVVEDDRLHIYSHFGSDDPDVLLDTIRFLSTARACRYVLLDHITMVVSGLAGEKERTALDYLSTRLEMMVKELNFALLLVSHVNDEGLTRGSRMISKIADTRIDLKRNLLGLTEEERNTTYLTISKNRFGRKTGPADILVFNPKTGKYCPKEEMFIKEDNLNV